MNRQPESDANTSVPDPFSAITMDVVNVAVLISDLRGVLSQFETMRQSGMTNEEIVDWIQLDETLPDLLAIFPLIEANKQAAIIFGYPTVEDLKKNAAATVVPETLDGIRDYLISIAHGQRDFESDNVYARRDGTKFHCRVRSTRVDTHSQQWAVATIMDISDHVAVGQRLQRTHDRQNVAIETSKLGIWDVDVRSAQVVFDRRYHRMLGYPDGQLNGPSAAARELVHPEDLENTRTWGRQLAAGVVSQIDDSHRLKCGDGNYRWFRCRAEISERSDDGAPLHLVGTLADVDAEVVSRQLLNLEREVLGLLASELSLAESLRHLALGIESVWDNVKCAINLHDPERGTLHEGAAPSLDPAYLEVVDGFVIADLPTVCGRSIERRAFTCIADLNDAPPEFHEILPFYKKLGLQGCWSVPVQVGEQVLATCCVFPLNPRQPTDDERIHLERLAQTAGLLIEADRQASQAASFDLQLRTKDRLESLGKLAGGIAHDFNNLLTVIVANAELIQIQPDGNVVEPASQISSAARLAADLCKKMLTYAGEVPSQLKPLDLSEVATEIVRIVRSGSPVGVDFNMQLHEPLPPVLADHAMISQLILNLVTNAAESVDPQGTVTISTGTEILRDEDLQSFFYSDSMTPGEHVFVRVVDNGDGIAPEVAESIFDPFFTT
ncbi:MAG: PAS domain-containing protein, partial [Pirellulaceae bacterium]|nr:PAS domain-containing protein [Pirellulaceae bacterium]